MYNGNPKLFDKICITCGIEFIGGTTAKFCPDCRAERIRQRDSKRHVAGPMRKLGSIDLCERCGKSYEVVSGNQKFCPSCSKIEQKRHKAINFAKLYADPHKRAAMLAKSIRWAKAHPKCVAHISHIYWIKKGKKKRVMKMAKQGGYRPNSGRKKELPEGAKPYSFKLTKDEQVKVREFINQLRK